MTAVSTATRAAVFARAAQRCESCGSSAQYLGWSVHHRTPRGMGGTRSPRSNGLANLLLLCGSGTTGCHGWTESHRTTSYDLGLLVRRHFDPTQTPVLYRGQWSLLADDGSVSWTAEPSRWPKATAT